MVEAPRVWILQTRYKVGDQLMLRREIALRTVMLLLVRDHGPLYVDEVQVLGRQISYAIILSLRDCWWCSETMARAMVSQMSDDWNHGYLLCEQLGLLQRQMDHDGYKQYIIARAGVTWIERYLPRWNKCPVTAFGGILSL